MLEKVKRVFSGLEAHFEAASGIGFEFLEIRAHVEHDLLIIAGFYIFLLNRPKDQHVHGESIG